MLMLGGVEIREAVGVVQETTFCTVAHASGLSPMRRIMAFASARVVGDNVRPLAVSRISVPLLALLLAGCAMPQCGGGGGSGGGGQAEASQQSCLACRPLTDAAKYGKPRSAVSDRPSALQMLHAGMFDLDQATFVPGSGGPVGSSGGPASDDNQ